MQPEQIPAQLLVVLAHGLPNDLPGQTPEQLVEQRAASLTLWPFCLSRTAKATNGWVSPRSPMVKRVMRMLDPVHGDGPGRFLKHRGGTTTTCALLLDR
jgi:hypothetical protein